MYHSWTLSLPEGVAVSVGAAESIQFEDAYGSVSLPWSDAGIRRLVQHLVFPGMDAQQLALKAEENGIPFDGARFIYFAQRLLRRGLLWIRVEASGQPFATLVPVSPQFSLSSGSLATGAVILSRFACLRRVDDACVLECPKSHARIVLHDERAMQLVHRLTKPATLSELEKEVLGIPDHAATQLLVLLSSADMLTEIYGDGTPAEDKDENLRYWDFHDLLFHARSRDGRHDGAVGAAFPWAGMVPPPPAVVEDCGDAAPCIDLRRPDLEEIERRDLPFVRVVEERTSIREFGAEPISLDQLSEFLYRVGRVKEQYDYEFDLPGGPVTMDFAARPYPSAGAVYELEIYPLVQQCSGLDAGLYRYDALRHRLQSIAADAKHRRRLLRGAADATAASADNLQVVLILSARFSRMMWKYSGMAYAAILKDVGVLYQTMYLTATAMGLAPCGIGAGNSDVFAAAIGSAYYDETSVGEFLIGTRGAAETKSSSQPDA